MDYQAFPRYWGYMGYMVGSVEVLRWPNPAQIVTFTSIPRASKICTRQSTARVYNARRNDSQPHCPTPLPTSGLTIRATMTRKRGAIPTLGGTKVISISTVTPRRVGAQRTMVRRCRSLGPPATPRHDNPRALPRAVQPTPHTLSPAFSLTRRSHSAGEIAGVDLGAAEERDLR